MNIFVITHADFETPGVIELWAQQNNHQLTVVKPYRNQKITGGDYDMLIIMGGPQSACNLDKDPYLYDEIQCIKQSIEQKKIVLGFCLGAQLIGVALGAPAEKSSHKEIGVFPLTFTENGKKDKILSALKTNTIPAIHWHNDMPGLTAAAQVLAFSEGCPRQMIRYVENVYGFQCHLEIDRSGIEELIKACPDDLKPGLYVQNNDELLSNDYATIHALMFKILDLLTK